MIEYLINPENWTGNRVKVQVDNREGDTQSFSVNGNTYVAIHKHHEDELDAQWNHDIMNVYMLSDCVDTETLAKASPIVRSFRLASEKVFTANNPSDMLGGYSRTDENPILAAAKVICNIV